MEPISDIFYSPMTAELWRELDYFRPDSKTDKWGDPFRIDADLMFGLEDFRKFVGRPVNVHCGVEVRGSGYHPKCCAVDVDVQGMHVIDQYVAASRFDIFNGIGIYPLWNRPGLHLDRRPFKARTAMDAIWGCIGPKKYVPVDRIFFHRTFVVLELKGFFNNICNGL